MRYLLGSPQHLRRVGYGLVAVAAALGAAGTLLRDTRDHNSWTYLLDAAAWLLAIAGAICEARVSVILSAFQPVPERRRATLLFGAGIMMALGACVLLSALQGDGPAIGIRTAGAALLIVGIGSGLGGGLSLAITVGARYAADRLANLEDS